MQVKFVFACGQQETQKIPKDNKINEKKSSLLAMLKKFLSVFVICPKRKYALLFMQKLSIFLKT